MQQAQGVVDAPDGRIGFDAKPEQPNGHTDGWRVQVREGGFRVQGGHRRGGRRGVAGAVGAEGGGRSLHGLTRTDTDKHGRFLEVRIQVRVQRSGETENRENGVFGDNEKIENHQK